MAALLNLRKSRNSSVSTFLYFRSLPGEVAHARRKVAGDAAHTRRAAVGDGAYARRAAVGDELRAEGGEAFGEKLAVGAVVAASGQHVDHIDRKHRHIEVGQRLLEKDDRHTLFHRHVQLAIVAGVERPLRPRVEQQPALAIDGVVVDVVSERLPPP